MIVTDPSSQEGVDEDPLADLHPAAPLPLLIRATNGKSKERRASKIKLSTVVQPDHLDGFFTRYAEICKSGMTALKKKDRRKEKLKAKARAKKKKGAATAMAPAEKAVDAPAVKKS